MKLKTYLSLILISQAYGFRHKRQTVKCSCPNGSPNNDCLDSNTISCQSCSNFFHLETDNDTNKQICVANVCNCANGVATPSNSCPSHYATTNVDHCMSCTAGFSFESANSNVCISLVCPCAGGTGRGAVAGTEGQCLQDGTKAYEPYQDCGACDVGYQKETATENHADAPGGTYTTNTCAPNKCDCDNGTAETRDNWYLCQHSLISGGNSKVEVCTACNDYYHIDNSQCTSCDPDNSDVGICVLNQCVCPNGTPKQNTCTQNQGHECESCNDDWYHVDDTSFQCVPNVCICANGTPADEASEQCTDHEANICKTCADFYHLDGNVCVENVCNCQNGNTVANNACKNHNGNECTTCNDYFHEVTDSNGITTCQANVCTCQNGIPKTGDCTNNGQEECDRCVDYYHIDGNSCVKNQCKCTNGVAVNFDACTNHGEEMCASCNDGYYETGNTCSEKTCICQAMSADIANIILPLDQTTPTGAVNTNCPVNGQVKCASCGDGEGANGGKWFHVHNESNDPAATSNDPHYNYCVLNVCTCEHGTPKQAYACPEHNKHHCDICDGDRILDTNFHCVNTKCNCANGQGWSSDGLCNNGRQYDSCDASGCFTGYHSSNSGNQITWTNSQGQVQIHDALHCVENQCSCENGTGTTGLDCATNNEPDCSACNTGYKLSGNTCVPNVCTCNNGTPKSNGNCSVDGKEECESCNTYYTIEGSGCIPATCTCSNGSPSVGAAQFCDGGENCQSCSSGYKLDANNACVLFTCRCDFGTPKAYDGSDETTKCSAEGAHECQDPCDTGYQLVNEVCEIMTCVCEHGTPVVNEPTICTSQGATKCSACNRDYEFLNPSSHTCDQKICNCVNGEELTGVDCKNHYVTSQVQSCQTNGCSQYFHNEANTNDCVANVCVCENGNKIDNNCKTHESSKCDSCNPGYELNGTANTEGTACLPITCTCHNGQGLSNGDCTDSNLHICIVDSCDGGFAYDSTDQRCKPECTCANGTPQSLDDCGGSGNNECSACDFGYNLSGEECIKNVCTCANGRTTADTLCDTNQLNNCVECQLGYTARITSVGDRDHKSCIKRDDCTCQYGNPAPICADGREECESGTCTNVATQSKSQFSYTYNSNAETHSIITCTAKTCTCANGTPKSEGYCTNTDSDQCDDCDPNYTPDGDACVGYTCKCDHGTVSPEGDCTGAGNHECASCNQYYHHQNGDHSECVENVCECHVGTAVPNAECEVHGEQQCATCSDAGYKLDSNARCVPRVCKCNHGTGVSDGTCLSDSVERCAFCDRGYKLTYEQTQFMSEFYESQDPSVQDPNVPNPIIDFFQETCVRLDCQDLDYMKLDASGNACENKVCSCSNGLPLLNEDCTDDTIEMCQSNGCFPGYKIQGTECVSDNECTCANGLAATGLNCNTGGAEKCQSCYPGFQLKGDVCDTIVCQCQNGQAVSDGTCYDATWNHCHSCNAGFHLKHDNARAYFSENDGLHFVSSCEPDITCRCDFGQPASGTDCVNDNDHTCEFCYSPGYSLDSNKHCVKNQCNCEHGTGAADGTCTHSDINKCVACDEGFHLEVVESTDAYNSMSVVCVANVPDCAGNTHPEVHENGSVSCKANVCLCPNGQPVADCPRHNSFNCQSCNSGFEAEGDLCSEIIPECECQFGVPARGDDCPTAGSTKCTSCYTQGYQLDANQNCVPKTCQCENGSPVANGSCLDESAHLCDSCSNGFHLAIHTEDDGDYAVVCQPDVVCLANQHVVINQDRTFSCADNVCLCQNGKITTNCLSHLDYSCESCDAGFNLNLANNSCEPIPTCTCQNGQPATGNDCLTNQEKCVSCHHGFEVVNGICDTIVCQCANGQPVSDGTCYDSSWNHCQTCDPGFHLKYDNPQAYFDGDSSDHFTSSCEPDKVCTCQFGEAATGNDCVSDGEEICSVCYSPGFILNADSVCVKRQCACENGVGVNDGTCANDSVQKCARCNNGFHLELNESNPLDSKSVSIICVSDLPTCVGNTHPEIREDGSVTCEDNVCLCPNGTPVATEECASHNSFACQTCDPGYEPEGDFCSAIIAECQCRFGVPSIGEDCPENGATHCQSCYSEGYLLNQDNDCVPKLCKCAHGQGVVDGSCLNTSNHACQSCDIGYHISVQEDTNENYAIVCAPDITCPSNQHVVAASAYEYACEYNVCLCNHGVGTSNCLNHLEHHCQSCDAGWKLNSQTNLCEMRAECFCLHGNPAVGEACLANAAHICADCYSPGYEVDQNQCRPKTCPCSNGVGATDGACLDARSENCAACNPGYHRQFSDQHVSICVADVVCEDNQHLGVNVEGQAICEDNVCLCPNQELSK